ncbi:MAG: cysteine-rich CWC family protein [Hydrogenophaga sp.]|uniref:cysteine-rich CWC family protein n=1 Tax=Hydrogenophaga sp. TaxID=1904254 RepID=UPI00257F929B|nr:cysteine-rich CWC family protein [Hydrogenophaga sp.]MBL0944845.1 cysteine-rich CWC family protein [Hydrogenophaga sp.]
MPTHPPPPIDPERCPLCGGDNRCAMEIERATGVPQPPCWCVSETFTPALLARLPEAARGAACICPACVKAALDAAR